MGLQVVEGEAVVSLERTSLFGSICISVSAWVGLSHPVDYAHQLRLPRSLLEVSFKVSQLDNLRIKPSRLKVQELRCLLTLRTCTVGLKEANICRRNNKINVSPYN